MHQALLLSLSKVLVPLVLKPCRFLQISLKKAGLAPLLGQIVLVKIVFQLAVKTNTDE